MCTLLLLAILSNSGMIKSTINGVLGRSGEVGANLSQSTLRLLHGLHGELDEDNTQAV
jgi:hypothetical protein